MFKAIVRGFIAVFVGVVACGAVIFATELLALRIHRPPSGFDMHDPEQMRAYLEGVPLSAMLLVLLGYVLGPFVGAWLAARLAGRAPYVHAGLVAAVFFALTVMNLISVRGQPVWFIVASLTAFIPFVLLAAWLARPRASGSAVLLPGQEDGRPGGQPPRETGIVSADGVTGVRESSRDVRPEA